MSNPGPVTAPGTGRIEPAPAAPPPVPPRPPTANGAPAGDAPDPWAGKLPRLPGIDFAHLLPERSAEHILAAEVHITLGRREPIEYILPVLSIAENREWKRSLEVGLTSLLDSLDEVGDNLGGVLAAFATVTPQLLDAVIAYDADGHLPARDELERQATDPQVLRAVLEIWSAANPFAQVAVAALREAPSQLVQATDAPQTNGSSTPTNTAQRRTAGRRATSKRR